MKKIEVKQFDIDEVDEITLLSVEEAKKIHQSIRARGEWCWLRSPGFKQGYAAYIMYGGGVIDVGHNVNYDNYTVRPAFRINNLKSEIGDRIMIGETWCTVIDEGLILADYSICEHRFDKNSNVWEISELKEFINSDEFKAMI